MPNAKTRRLPETRRESTFSFQGFLTRDFVSTQVVESLVEASSRRHSGRDVKGTYPGIGDGESKKKTCFSEGIVVASSRIDHRDDRKLTFRHERGIWKRDATFRVLGF